MYLNETDLLQQAKTAGFRSEMLEKVILLMALLNEIFDNSYLKQRLVLKGGTALNLFHFNLPRLSVDVDLNYIGHQDRQTMLEEREELEAILSGLIQRSGLTIKRAPTEHAGGKWRLTYNSAVQPSGNIELDLSYLFRIPLWPITFQDSYQLGNYQAKQIPVLDLYELVAGKLTALMARRASRDLYDVYHLSTSSIFNEQLDVNKLRLAFIVYGAMNRHDWRTLEMGDISFDSGELKNNLIPVLNQKSLQQSSNLKDWADQLITGCKNMLSNVLPFTENETAFLEKILEKGEVDAALITTNSELQQKISNHPGLLWKIQHVKKFKN